MSIFTKLAQQIFASVDESGTPRTISEQEVGVWGTELERLVSLFVSAGGLVYSGRAELDADLARPAKTLAWVLGDPIAANNGIYGKVGASGSGSWTRRGDLPFSFITASDAGAGTPNAIQAITTIPVSGSSLVWMNVAKTTTGSPVTVSFNGGTQLTIKTNGGNDITADGLAAGMVVLGVISGTTFRLLSDQSSAVILAAAEAAAAAAQAFANSVMSFETVSAFMAAKIPSGINTVTLAGYYTAGDYGAHRKVSLGMGPFSTAPERSFVSDRWWEIAKGQVVYAEMFGAKGDYNPANPSAAFNNAPAVNAALAFSKNLEFGPGVFCYRGSVAAGHYVKVRGIKPFSAMGVNADVDPAAGAGQFTFFVFRDIPKTKTFGSMITNRRPFGGVVANPNAGSTYTLASGTSLNTYDVTDFTNKNANGASPASAREFAIGFSFGRLCDIENIGFRSTRQDGAYVSDSSIMDWGNSPDIMVLAENAYYSRLRGCHIGGWGCPVAGLAKINHNSGDGYPVESDGFIATDNIYEGHASILDRGADECYVLGATATTIDLPWWESHQFASSGQVNVNGAIYTYTGLTYTSGPPKKLTFMGVAPSAASLTAGASLMRQQDYNDSGIGETRIEGHARCITHASLKPSTDLSFTDARSNSARVIEVGSAKARGIRLNLTTHAREDILAFFDDVGTIHMDGYPEVKVLLGMSPAARIIAISTAAAAAGMGGIPYPIGGARDLRFRGGWNQTLTVDTSPTWRPQSTIGRFSTMDGLCSPDGGENPFYSVRSRDGTARRIKAPGTLGAKHPLQYLTASAAVRESTDQAGHKQIGSGLDTETALLQWFNVINNGGHYIRSVNTASNSFAGYRAENISGNSDFGADTDGAALIRVGGNSMMKVGTNFIRPYTDNTHSIGTASFRATQLFAATPTIGTSDERLKADIQAIEDIVLDAWADIEWCQFRFTDGRRVHVGLIAQRVRDVFAKHGLDPFAFGLLCHDRWEELTEAVYEPVEAKIVSTEIVEESVETEVMGADGKPVIVQSFVKREVENVELVLQEKLTDERRVVLAAGDRFGLRYEECLALEAAFQRRRMSRLEGVLAAHKAC